MFTGHRTVGTTHAKTFHTGILDRRRLYVGRLKEVPGIFSQGESLEELTENIRDAYQLMKDDDPPLISQEIHQTEVEIDV